MQHRFTDLLLGDRMILTLFPYHALPCCIPRGRLPGRMQCPKESYKSGGFCRTQIASIGGHVAASLNHLANELVVRESHSDTVQGGPPLATHVAKSVAIAALL